MSQTFNKHLATVIDRTARIIDRRGFDVWAWHSSETWRSPKTAPLDLPTAVAIALRMPPWSWQNGGPDILSDSNGIRPVYAAIAEHLISTGAATAGTHPAVVVTRWEQSCGTDVTRVCTVLSGAADVLR